MVTSTCKGGPFRLKGQKRQTDSFASPWGSAESVGDTLNGIIVGSTRCMRRGYLT